jgi:hypothetical protein
MDKARGKGMSEEERKSKIIEVSEELLDVFERLRKKVSDVTWGVESMSYYNLSKVLSRKINAAGII